MKRILDILLSLIALLLLMPVILVISILVRVFLGRPIFFRQERPGLNGNIFHMIKFRSMKDAYDAKGNLLSDELRLTKLGRFIRASSLDELPGLWCVLKGDMSIVGPRPLLVDYLPLYSKEQARRHLVKPGLTGWAQVNGRNAISWEEKFDLDTWYVDNQSFYLDLKIILLTIKKVLISEGIGPEDGLIMPRFTGSKDDNAH